MITRALAGLVLATHLAAGLLTAGISLSSSAEIRPDAPAREDGPAFHLDRRGEAATAAVPRNCDRLPSELRRATAAPPPADLPCPFRLTLCTEFTKPDYLKLRLSATPQSYRSPPA